MTAVLVAVVIILALAVAAAGASVRILREYERAVVFRLGRLVGAKGPGIVLLVPLIDRMVRVDLRTVTFEVPPQDVITRDNVPAKVNAVAYFRVVDPVKSVVEVERIRNATSQIAQTTLRSVLGRADLDTLLAEREQLNENLQQIIDEQTEPWGVKVTTVEIKDVGIPQGMQRAMARQAEAERERRAKVINAEGEFQASERLFDAAEVMSGNPAALQLRYLQTLLEIGTNQNSTIVLPVPIDLIKPLMQSFEDGNARRERARERDRAACGPEHARAGRGRGRARSCRDPDARPRPPAGERKTTRPGRRYPMKLFILVARLLLGGLFFGHGAQKLFGWFGGFGPDGTGGWLESLGVKPGRQHAMAAGASEMGGGALLAAGLATPAAAAAITGVMATAIRTVHQPNGPWVDRERLGVPGRGHRRRAGDRRGRPRAGLARCRARAPSAAAPAGRWPRWRRRAAARPCCCATVQQPGARRRRRRPSRLRAAQVSPRPREMAISPVRIISMSPNGRAIRSKASILSVVPVTSTMIERLVTSTTRPRKISHTCMTSAR